MEAECNDVIISLHLTLLNPKLFWGLPDPRGGGGHIVPLQNFYISPDCSKNLAQV